MVWFYGECSGYDTYGIYVYIHDVNCVHIRKWNMWYQTYGTYNVCHTYTYLHGRRSIHGRWGGCGINTKKVDVVDVYEEV